MLAGALLIAAAACTPPGLPPPLAPTGTTAAPSAPAGDDALVIGVTGRVLGFNPYAMADFSAITQAIAQLVLPSPYTVAANGAVLANPDLIDAAGVTSYRPFVVTYTLDRSASWSDGTPVTAEDFGYLREQMVTQPAVVGPAGYELITAVRSRDAGKTVEVEFAEPVPDWRSLFAPLVPSHILKDSPGGWATGLVNGVAVSANRYKMLEFDPLVNEVRLVRNDKYWGDEPLNPAVVLRLGAAPELVEAFGRGEVRALLVSPGAEALVALEAAVPEGRRVDVPQPATAQLVFNTTEGPTAEPEVRQAIAAGLDAAQVAAQLSGGVPEAYPQVTSQVRLPAQPVDATDPPTTGERALVRDPQASAALLEAAGYDTTGLYAVRDGAALRLRLAYPSGDEDVAAAARNIQTQLGRLGIEVDLLADNLRALLSARVAAGVFDLALLTVPRPRVDADAAASAFGCAAIDGTDTGTDASADASADAGDPAVDPVAAGAPPRTGNLSGFCEPGVQQALTRALTGAVPVGVLDPPLWTELPVLPLAEPSMVFAVSEPLGAVVEGARTGWLWSGPLQSLPDWPV